MRIERPLVPAAAIFVLAGALFACSPKTAGTNTGTGGTTGSGGQSDSGGATGNGGTNGSGGATASGGTTSSGGTTTNGGDSGSGGTSSTGGATSAGGSSGSGGVTGNGGSKVTGGSSGTGGGAGSGGKTGSGGGAGIGDAASGGGGSAGSDGGAAGSGGTAGSGSGGSAGSGGTSATVACSDTSTTPYSFTKAFDNGSIAVTGSTKTYYTMTNWWHKFASQTVTINGLSMTVGNTGGSGGASVPATDGNPMGFPTIFIGSYQGHATVGSNLPKQVSSLTSVPTIFSTNASTLDSSNFNATYDVWFTKDGTALAKNLSSPGTGGAYLMVWMYKPTDRQPRGGVNSTTGSSPNYPAQTINGVDGTWDVWVDSSTDPPCISYVSSTPLDGLSYDLNNFIQDSVTNKYGVTSSMYLSLVFAGFEIWGGGDGLTTKQFCATVN